MYKYGDDLAALFPFSVDGYARLGWEVWRGPRFIRSAQGRLASPPDEEVMILRLPNTPALDLSAPLSAEWRERILWKDAPGAAWLNLHARCKFSAHLRSR